MGVEPTRHRACGDALVLKTKPDTGRDPLPRESQPYTTAVPFASRCNQAASADAPPPASLRSFASVSYWYD